MSPTHYVPQIARAIYLAAKDGLSIPIVYNCGGYESTTVLELLDGIVDIYLPDAKYMDEEIAKKYSKIKDYSKVVKEALIEMKRQVGDIVLNRDRAVRGLLIRHLVLPHNLAGTKEFLHFVVDNLGKGTWINIMGQYHPAHMAHKYEELTSSVSRSEVEELKAYGRDLGLNNIID